MKSKNEHENMVFPWSYEIDADKISRNPMRLDFSPGEQACRALARRLGIPAVESLRAEITLSRESGNRIVHVRGRLRADVVQNCVVTLEPVKNQIDDTFEAWYADPADAVSLTKARHERLAAQAAGEKPILDESEDPEPIVGGKIDVGDLTAQYLSLFLDPYPHAPGVHRETGDDAPRIVAEASAIRKNPFAALKDWKEKKSE